MAEPKREPPLELEKYATLHAEIEAGAELEKVLEREKVAQAVWLGAQAYWLKRMAEEAQSKRFEMTNRYQAVFKTKRKVFEARFANERRRQDRAPIAAPGVDVLDEAKQELQAPARAETARLDVPEPPMMPLMRDPGAAQSFPQPAYMRDAAAQQGAARGGFTGAAPAPAHAGGTPERPAMVSGLAVPQPPQMPPAYATNAVPPATVKGTEALPFDAVQAAIHNAMPFKPAVAANPPPGMNVEPPAGAGGTRDLTGTLGGSAAAPQGEAIPFKAPSDAKSPAQSTFRGGTVMPDPELLAAAKARAMPFTAPEPGAPRPPPPAKLAETLADTQPGSPLQDDYDVPKTKMLDADAVAAAIAKATPFKTEPKRDGEPPDSERGKTMAFDVAAGVKAGSLPFGGGTSALPPGLAPPAPPNPASAAPAPVSMGPKRFSINVFASLTAEIAETPADADAIRTRYGISEAEHRDESQKWTSEFQRSEETRQRYLAIVQRYRGYIQQRKKT